MIDQTITDHCVGVHLYAYDLENNCQNVVSHGAVRSAASSYAAMHMVAGSCPVLVIA